jgi:hypothetical protein
MRFMQRWAMGFLAAAGLLSLGGCTTAGLLLSVAGVATDSSVTWEIAKHVHQKMTDGDPVSCFRLNSVERALTPRCGEFVPGSLVAADIARTTLQECPLTLAVRDVRLWPVLPELLDKGATPVACFTAPLVEMAQARDPLLACPDFSRASPEVLNAFERLASIDGRSVHHDVVRLLSCPSARQFALDRVLDRWLAQGRLPVGLGFGVLGALHPDYLDSPFARDLEAHGHTAQASLGGDVGKAASGFEEALRTQHWAALEWWFERVPKLINEVPPRQGNQVAWVPLQQVLVPAFISDDTARKQTVQFLIGHGANPWQRLPGQTHHSVVSYARFMKSPLVDTLQQPPLAAWPNRTAVAATAPR